MFQSKDTQIIQTLTLKSMMKQKKVDFCFYTNILIYFFISSFISPGVDNIPTFGKAGCKTFIQLLRRKIIKLIKFILLRITDSLKGTE